MTRHTVALSEAALRLSYYRHTEDTTREEVLRAAQSRGIQVTNGRVAHDKIADLYFAVQLLRKGDSA